MATRSPWPGRSSEPVYRITGVDTSLTQEQRGRARRYLVSMGLRTVCFLGAIVTSGAVRWGLVAGALILPWIAVVVANAGREPDRNKPPTVSEHRFRRGLGRGEPPPAPSPHPPPV